MSNALVFRQSSNGITNILSNVVQEERKYPWLLTPVLFFILGIFGMTWIPFYPWWMVLLGATLVSVISIKFPYLALILLSTFVSAAAGYQLPEFGLFMILFLLVLLVISLFEWKLGYLALLMIFLSRFGLSLIVPVAAAAIMPLLLSVAVLVVGGVFLTFLVTCGNMNVAGMLVGPAHTSSFMVFFEPTLDSFTPADLGNSILAVQDANLDILVNVIGDNFGLSAMPVIQILLFGIAVYLVHKFFHRSVADSKYQLVLGFVPAGIIAGTFLGAYSYMLSPSSAG
ncbi:MAG: hypothetical protein KAJ33_00925, partial [Thermoplasmata archaeon]|nr:hypothetical protein [Thermoplasmata archaeon]